MVTIKFVSDCWLCKQTFENKELTRIGNRPLCSTCGFKIVKYLDAVNAHASEIGKVASAAYQSEDDKDTALESCVIVSNELYLRDWKAFNPQEK